MTTTTDDSGAERIAGATDWVDVRMTDPEEGEWAVDLVAFDGRVTYVDLRVRRELLASFVACLLEDLDEEAAGEVLAEVAEQVGVERTNDE